MIEQLAQFETLKRDYSVVIMRLLLYYKPIKKFCQLAGRLYYGLENGRFYQGIPKKIPKGFNPVEQEWYKRAIKSQGEVFGQNLIWIM